MSSWWRRIAEQLGATALSGSSWKRKVAAHFDAVDNPGRSFAQKIAGSVGVERASGSWPKRMTPLGTPGRSWPRALASTDAFSGGGGGGPTLFFADNFDRTDGPIADGVNWFGTDDWQISSFSAFYVALAGDEASVRTASLPGADVYVKITLTLFLAWDAGIYAMARYVDDSNFVGIRAVDDATLHLVSMVAGVPSTTIVDGLSLADGDVIELRLEGASATMLQDDVEILGATAVTSTEAGLPCGFISMLGNDSSGLIARAFECGTL